MIIYNIFKRLYYDLKKIEQDTLENIIKEEMNTKLIYFTYEFEYNQNNDKGNIKNLIDIFESNRKKNNKWKNKEDIMNLILEFKGKENEFLEALQK